MRDESKISICNCPKNKRQVCTCESPNSHFIEDGMKDSCNLFDILAHNYASKTPPKQKSVNVSKVPKTTYRQDYNPKCIQMRKKASPPFPEICISDEKMSYKTTHKTDFKPYSEKSKKDISGKMVKPKNNLVCSSQKFIAKSETKSSYKIPAFGKALTFGESILRERKFANKDNITISGSKNQPFASDTTYSSAYKVPKGFQKSKLHIPKSDIHKPDVKKAFKDISQYRSDFKRPKKIIRECIRKLQVYSSPDEPMENKTTYRVDYNVKKLKEKKTWKGSSTYSTCRADVSRLYCPCNHNVMICQCT